MSSLLKDRAANSKSLGPITARIRPGLKVPTKAAITASQSNPALAAIFMDVEDGRIATREAEKRILAITEGKMKYPFTPRNTPCFNISSADFSAPELGGIGVVKLLDLYGEERDGYPGKRLWRIPMVFADVNDVEKIFPSEFRVGQGANMYRSEYLDGKRYCMVLPPIDKDGNAKRKHLARTPVSRGLCDPEHCAEFGSGACKFSGTLRFHIPGFPGIAPFAMGTTSTYAAQDIYFQLEQVIEKMGRIPRTKPDGSPIFWLVKSQKQRSYFDENGEKKTGLQWVPDLIADIEFPKLLEAAERQALIGMNPAAPTTWLAPSALAVVTAGASKDVSNFKVVGEEPQGNTAKPLTERTPIVDQGGGAETALSNETAPSFHDMALQNGLTDLATRWAQLRFGEGWENDSALNEQATTVLEKFLKGGKNVTQAFLELMVMIFENKMDDKLVDSFIRQRFGNKFFKDVAALLKAKATLVDLLESGVDVAQAYMRNEIAKAA